MRPIVRVFLSCSINFPDLNETSSTKVLKVAEFEPSSKLNLDQFFGVLSSNFAPNSSMTRERLLRGDCQPHHRVSCHILFKDGLFERKSEKRRKSEKKSNLYRGPFFFGRFINFTFEGSTG